MTKSKSYVLGVGPEGFERLEIQHELYEHASRDLLQRAGLKEGMRVLEVGCGTGIMSRWIASVIGPKGKLTALDISREQLELAQKKDEKKRIEFIEWDILTPKKSWIETFDLIYGRFFFGHLEEPLKALEILVTYLKQGGRLVCDEGDSGACFCTPPSEPLEKMLQLYRKCQALKGGRPVGREIYHFFMSLGLQEIDVSLFQPLLKTERHKMLFPMALQEFAPFALESNLITEKELESLKSDIKAFTRTDTFVGYIRNTQIFGTKR